MDTKNNPIKKVIASLLVVILISPAFFLNIVPFPLIDTGEGNYGRPCYSPNKEFYIERYTTLPKALYINPAYSKSGIAILYTKDGKEIFRGSAEDIYKPGWNGDQVGFFGKWGGNYSVKLPNVAGDYIGCYR